jgi:hypothetical protein
MLQPNQSALMMLFGSYRGTDYSTGLRWANPFLNKKKCRCACATSTAKSSR